MLNRCTVCNHPDRPEIDRGLINGVAYRALAAQYGLSPSALHRHTKHLAHALDHQRRQDDQAQLCALLERLDLLEHRLDRLFHNSQDFRSQHIALGCIQESLRLLALQQRLRQALDRQPLP